MFIIMIWASTEVFQINVSLGYRICFTHIPPAVKQALHVKISPRSIEHLPLPLLLLLRQIERAGDHITADIHLMKC